ncbi:MAG: hypothetical protein P3X22_004880 [Thermoprotei archaeon]|nr:hypothetical protein [Thermoprotei archaeon]
MRVLSFIALIGFLAVGLMFALKPEVFTGSAVGSGSAMWHSLTLAFMATVSVIAFMIMLNPRAYWSMLIPLAVGKLASSVSSFYWYAVLSPQASPMLLLNYVVDGLIGIIALALYAMILFKFKA